MERYRQFRHDLSKTIPGIFTEHFDLNGPPNLEPGTVSSLEPPNVSHALEPLNS